MKKMMITLSLLGLLLLPLSLEALEWECKDMKKFVDTMYDAATYLNNHPNFDENPQIEADIDRLMGVLKAIANDEEMDSFTDAVEEMAGVWNKEEWYGDDIGDFRRAMDSVTVNLERVYEKYCD